MLYWLYLLTLGLVNTGLLYLVNAFTFRIRGQTLVSHADPQSSLYGQLKRRTSNIVILINTVLLLVLAYLLFLEVRSLQDMNKSSIASPLLFGVALAVTADIVGMWLMLYLNRTPSPRTKNRNKDDHWLA